MFIDIGAGWRETLLYKYTLRDEQTELLRTIAQSLFSDKEIKKDFSKYAREVMELNDDVSRKKFSSNLWKISTGKVMRDYKFYAVFYDYLTVSPLVENKKELFEEAAKSQIRDLKKCLDSQVNEGQVIEIKIPFQRFANDIGIDHTDIEAPEPLIGEFIGYRLDSDGEIIRSYFNIWPFEGKGGGGVRYEGGYQYGAKNWREEGDGLYYQETTTLTLLGHARSVDEEISRGFSTYALKYVGASVFMFGQVQTQDVYGPVSARILFIPLNSYNKTPEQEKLDHVDFVEALITGPNYLEEMECNIGHLFRGRGKEGLFEYISNTTSTALDWMPDFSVDGW